MSRVIIFGLGDVARLAHYYFNHDSPHSVEAFTVESKYMQEATFMGLPVIPFEEIEKEYSNEEYLMFVAIGYTRMNKLRAEIYQKAKEKGYKLTSYVSSNCTYLSEHLVGDNCFILEDNTIQPFVKIGNNVVIWSGNHIGHDAVIEDHCFITSHTVISGHARIEPYCFIGVNATIRDQAVIKEGTLLGGGVTMMSDSEEYGVYLAPKPLKMKKRSDLITIS